MSRHKGWIKIHRKIQDHWLYETDEPYTKREAWIDILLNANHKERKWPIGVKMQTVYPGQQVRSMRTLSMKWNWSIGKVKRFLEMLESDNMIEVSNETQTTRISICNWEAYQVHDEKNGTQTEQERKQTRMYLIMYLIMYQELLLTYPRLCHRMTRG